MRRPRVLLVGGPDVDARLDLMDRLRDRYELAAVGSSPDLAERFAERGYAYGHYRLERGYSLRADLVSLLELREIFHRRETDLVHCFDTKPCIVGRLAARLTGVPVISGTLPGLGALYTYRTPEVLARRRVLQRLQRWASRASDMTVFQNPDDLREMLDERVVVRGRCRVISGSGVSEERFSPATGDQRRAARRELGLHPERPVVAYAGRLVRAKGALELAMVAPGLRAQVAGVQVVLAAPCDVDALDGLTEGEIETVARETDWRRDGLDVARLLAAADLFVFPSFYREGVPRVLIEAALAEVPIVTTDRPGCREVVEHAVSGVLVEARRPEALTAAVVTLLSQPERAKALARMARQRALERFGLSTIARAYERLWDELLSERAE